MIRILATVLILGISSIVHAGELDELMLSSESKSITRPSYSETIPLIFMDGGLAVRVEFGGSTFANFQIDTGATVVAMKQSLAKSLLRQGLAYIDHDHPVVISTMADGSKKIYSRIRIRKMKVGTHILTDVRADYADNDNASLLLGNNVLRLLPRWSIDYEAPALIIMPK